MNSCLERGTKENGAKRTLRAGGTVLGCTVNFVHAGLTEYLGRLGYDCLIIDAEHGVAQDDAVEEFARACDVTGVTSMLRLPVSNPLMQRYLGLGIDALYAPQVRSAEEAREVVDASKFSPLGRRGLGNYRATDFGLGVTSWPAFMERANAQTLIMVAVEDPEGLSALPGILAIPEIDIVLIGTADLSNSIGVPGQLRHPTVLAMTDDAIGQIRAAGKAAGLPCPDPAAMRDAHARGARFLLSSVTRPLVLGSAEILSTLKELDGR